MRSITLRFSSNLNIEILFTTMYNLLLLSNCKLLMPICDIYSVCKPCPLSELFLNKFLFLCINSLISSLGE